MYHSITFFDGTGVVKSGNTYTLPKTSKNTWNDWYLIPSQRPDIALPGVSTHYVDIPGRDGSLDISEQLTGHQVYSDRSGSLDFYVANDKKNDTRNFTGNWADLRNEIVKYLHGKQKCIVLESEPNYYYKGRFTVDSWASEPSHSKITISYRLQPFKYHLINANYKNGTNPEMADVSLYSETISKQMPTIAYGTDMKLGVRMMAGSMVSASFGGKQAVLSPASPEATLGNSGNNGATNTLTLTGSGIVSIAYGGGML